MFTHEIGVLTDAIGVVCLRVTRSFNEYVTVNLEEYVSRRDNKVNVIL